MNCIRLTNTNKEESLLFNDLFKITTNENEAENLYSYFTTPAFLEVFGDYNSNFKTGMIDDTFNDRIDINGEPKLFLSKKLNKYYFLDKSNEPIFYPHAEQGIRESFDTNDIKLFSKILASSFYKENINFDYETLEFTKKSNKLLREYVTEFISKKASELQNNDNPDMLLKGIALEQSSKHINEWIEEIKDYFSSLQINYDIDEDIPIEEEGAILGEELPSDELMRRESFLKSNKNNVNNNIKLFLSLITSDTLNDFNEFNFVSFDDIYSTLNSSLSNKIALDNEDIFDIYLDIIDSLSNVKPYFKVLYEELSGNNITEDFKNQFSSAFYLYKNNFLGSEKSIDEKGDIVYNIRNLSEVGSRKTSVISQWFFNFKQLDLSPSNIDVLYKDINSDLDSFVREIKNIKTEEDLIPHLNNIKKNLNSLGVEFTEKGFDYYLNELQFEDLSLGGKVKKVIKTFKDLTYALDYYKETKDNLFLNQNIFKQMAESEAFFMEEGSDASIFTIGKTKWVYSLPSYIDLKIQKWKKNPDLLYKHFLSTPYNKGSVYMNYLTASDIADEEQRKEEAIRRVNDIEIGIFNSVQIQGNATNASDNKSLTYTDSLNDYIHKVLASRKGGKTYHKTALAADKATEYQINFGNNEIFNLYTNTRLENNKVTIDNSIVDIFYNYFKSEYERMVYEYDIIQKGENLLPNYHLGSKNALKSQLFPSLSVNYINGKAIVPVLPITLYDSTGKPMFTNLDAVKEQVSELIKGSLVAGIESTYTTLFDNNIFILNNDGVRQNNTIDENIFQFYVDKAGKRYAPLQIAGDFFINSVISQVEYSKMFTGDVAYYKNITDYKKRVPATYTDGQYMRVKDKNFNVSIIAAVEISAQDLDKLAEYLPENILEKYSNGNINSTDAQAWITPARWKFILKGLGKWNDKREAVYKEMQKSKPIFTNEQLKLVAQPLKGVYFDINDKGVPSFLKYSQAVLVPNLIKGTGLEILFDKMTKDKSGTTLPYSEQIHELITQDGIKVGSPIPSITHDVNGDVLFDSVLNKVKLNNNSWKLQQDLPTKGIKSTDVGSQIQKNIFQGLAFNLDVDFELGNDTLNGSELIDYINSITDNLSNKGKEVLINKFGLDFDSLKVTNEDALYKSLIDQLKTRKDVPSNFIKALEAGISPYGIPGAFQMFQNVFSSIVNKELVKIQTNGGGFIQMADYGLSKGEANERGIIFTPWFNENKLGTYRKVNGKKSLSPAGIFLSGSFIAKHIPNYKSLTSKQLFGTLNNETGKYEGGKIDQEILTNIIGYRIPNQGLPSNDALQVMGILPEEMGDTVIAYTGMTTKTGSDFDIDKMYLMIPSFNAIYDKTNFNKGSKYIKERGLRYSQLTDEVTNQGYDIEGLSRQQIYKVFINDILFSDNDTFNEYNSDFHNDYESKDISADKLKYVSMVTDEFGQTLPLSQQPVKALQNILIESYKSVLTNEEVIKDVMNPIDLSNIEDDIKNLFPDETPVDLMSFDAISDLTLKDEFRLGKAGLGQNVNSLVDSVRGSMGNLYLDFFLGWGNSNGSGTIFDSQFSEELNGKEINNYVTSFNEGLHSDKHITKEQVQALAKIKLNDSMMMLVNGFVDIAKDPYIVKGNWVTQTNNLGFMLLRAGVHPFKVNAFLAQPILKEYVKFRTNQESKSINDSSKINERFKLKKATEYIEDGTVTINGETLTKKNLFTSILIPFKINSFRGEGIVEDSEREYESKKKDLFQNISKEFLKRFKVSKEDLDTRPELVDQFIDLKDEFVNAYEKVFEAEIREFSSISLKELRDEIKLTSNIEVQIAVLKQFEDWMDTAKVLAANVSASKVDVDGKGKNINSLIVSSNKIRNILDKEDNAKSLKGFKSKLYRNGKSTLLNTAVRNGLGFSYDIMKANPKYFFSANDTTVSTFNVISDYIYGERLQNNTLADKLEKAYYSYILSGFPALQTTKEQKIRLVEDMPIKLSEMKKQLPSNTLIGELFIKASPLEKTSFLSMPNVKKSTSFQNELTDSWKDLFNSHPQFAEDLVKYSYLISGFNNSINQFHKYIPYEWFNKNRFNSYLKELSFDYSNFIDKPFIDQFHRNNYEDNTVAIRIFKSKMTAFPNDFFGTGYILKSDDTNIPNPYLTQYHIETEDETIIKYYKLVGKNIDGDAVYLRTSLLGYKDIKGNKIVEYSLGYNSSMNFISVFPENKNEPGSIDSALYLETLNNIAIAEAYNPDMIVNQQDDTVFQEELPSVVEKSISFVDNSLSWDTIKNLPVYSELGINTMRKQGNEHFGNPFTGTKSVSEKNPNLILVDSIDEAVQSYKEWLEQGHTTYENKEGVATLFEGKQEQRDWILEQINSGKLDSSKLLYMKSGKNYNSHADVLLEVIKVNRNLFNEGDQQSFDFKC